VFVRDIKTDTTVLVSRQSATDGGAGADGDSFYPALSGDGRYVAFQSAADNLSESDNDGVANIFLRDMSSGTTVLVSRQSAADGGAGGELNSYVPSVSAHGRYVAFWSYAHNLSSADRDTGFIGNVADVFVRDMRTDTLILASRGSARHR
jgi:Tol biopolymer transport system component